MLFKYHKFSKYFYVFSGLLFLICLQTLFFQEVFFTNNAFGESNNESKATDSPKNFFTIDNKNNTSINKNETNNGIQKIKIVAAGDFGCGPVAQNNIKKIELQKPDIFLVIGDLSYEPSLDCWYDMTKALDSKIKIAIGNHEDEEEKTAGGSKELTESLLKHYNLSNTYYSFNYGNVHILALDTQLEFSFDIFKPNDEDEDENDSYINENDMSDGKYFVTTLDDILTRYNITTDIPPSYLLNDKRNVKNFPFNIPQYNFVVNDLKKTSMNSSIDWIIVMFHKPIYSSLSSHIQEYIMRDKYQPIFDKYGVDIVLQGHNHIYDRTVPIKFDHFDNSTPIVDKTAANNTNNFLKPDGSVYTVLGSGGKSNHIILNHPDYVAKQFNGFGFLAIAIEGMKLDANFYDIGYKCKEEKLNEKDMKEGDFTIFDMSTCKNDKNNNLKLIDRYTISK